MTVGDLSDLFQTYIFQILFDIYNLLFLLILQTLKTKQDVFIPRVSEKTGLKNTGTSLLVLLKGPRERAEPACESWTLLVAQVLLDGLQFIYNNAL